MSATLNPNHADDTGILSPNEIIDWVVGRTGGIACVSLSIEPDGQNFQIGSELITNRTTTCGRLPISAAGLRQMRALIDRALGDRT